MQASQRSIGTATYHTPELGEAGEDGAADAVAKSARRRRESIVLVGLSVSRRVYSRHGKVYSPTQSVRGDHAVRAEIMRAAGETRQI